MQPLTNCPVCEGPRQRSYCKTRDRHYGIAGEYTLVRCDGCRVVFLNPMYSEDELTPLYPQDYYAHNKIIRSGGIKERVKQVLGMRIHTKDPAFSKPGRVLDIGCGSGWFLEEMRDEGWETFGVEINPDGARRGREVAGLDIRTGTLQDANFPSEYFDYVRSNHSFEHISHPNETLSEIHRILKSDGKLMIGVPNIASFNATMFGRYWWYLGAPVHTFNYTPHALSRLLEKQNFVVEKITYNSDYSGVLGSFQIWLNRNTSRKSIEGWAYNQKPLRLVSQWIAKILDVFKTGDAIEVIARKVTR